MRAITMKDERAVVTEHRSLREGKHRTQPQPRFWHCSTCGEAWIGKSEICPVCGCGSVNEVSVSPNRRSGDYLDALLADQEMLFALS